MPHLERTTTGRIARAVVAAAVVGAALTGCTVAVEGTPHVDQQAVAPSTPPTSRPAPPAPRADAYRTPRSIVATPPLPLNSDVPLAPHASVLARWVADGWTPRPLLRQTDPATGASVAMFGRATQTSDDPVPFFTATGAPTGVISQFAVGPSPAETRIDSAEAFRKIAARVGGRLVGHERHVVDGRPVIDAVIEGPLPGPGTEMRTLIRRIDLPDHIVLVQTLGPRSDARTTDEVHGIVTSTFTAP